MKLIKAILRALLAGAMIAVGVMHFTNEPFFTRIVPSWLPMAKLLVYVSGVFEIALGVLVLVPKTSRFAGLGLTALYVAVFPANVNMVLHPELGGTLPTWALWARLPFQILFILFALWVTEALPKKRTTSQPLAP
ncbi:DoxX family protein [soil metagenome]